MFKFEDIGLETDLVVIISIVMILVLIVLFIVQLVKITSLRKRYEVFMKDADGKSLEQAFQKKFENMNFINEKLKEVDIRLDHIDKNLLTTYQKMGRI